MVKDSVHREAICPKERLCLKLRYLASGDSHVSLAASYRVGQTTVGGIIPETYDTLWDILIREGFMNVPKTPEEWDVIASEMERRCNFPNFRGAVHRNSRTRMLDGSRDIVNLWGCKMVAQ